MRLVRMMPGIGDNIWIFQKLISQKEKFDFHITDKQPQRGKQIFDLLPQVSNSCEYVGGIGPTTIKSLYKEYAGKPFKDITDKSFSLEINTHLEAGKRIEDWLPDLDTKYVLPWKTSPFKIAALNIMSHLNPAIGIYCSAYSTNRAWGFWNAVEWFDFIQRIHAERPDVTFVIIGASFDIDLGADLMKKLTQNRIPFVDTIGQSLGVVVEIMKRLDYFIGFPSGLSILNETLEKKTFMFYPNHLDKMRFAWAKQDRIKSGDYLAPLFDTPANAFTYLMNKNGLQL